MNQAVRECENYHKLKEMQKKLDKRAIDASTDPNLVEIKVSFCVCMCVCVPFLSSCLWKETVNFIFSSLFAGPAFSLLLLLLCMQCVSVTKIIFIGDLMA